MVRCGNSVFYSHVVKQRFIELVQNSVPRSEMITSGQPYLVNIMYNCLAIVVAFLSGIGMYSIHFVKKHH